MTTTDALAYLIGSGIGLISFGAGMWIAARVMNR